VINWLEMLQSKGVELIVCTTCLEYFGLKEQVRIGRMAGMPDILAAMQTADKVVAL
jgi:sulfur relay (sulfurtransferase) complex TusBCD TusD component (DsrE family)